MSEYEIPFHIQEEILKRLPVKSLIQFRSVSKEWKSLIDSSQFIAAHCLNCHTHPQHLLISCQDLRGEVKYVCYIDDETFPHQRSLPTLPPPLSTYQFVHPKVAGSSRGLVCLYGRDQDFTTDMALLWNPSIRKSIVIDLPAKQDSIAFGVCPVTNDPKMVSITQSDWDVPETSYTCEVMVYTLSSGKWRSLSANLPTKRIHALLCLVVIDGFIYWRAVSGTHSMIMSFDVTGERFETIDLPDSLSRHDHGFLNITKLRESLAILQYKENICTVWMMEHDERRSFTKLFTITITAIDRVMGFRRNGMPIVQVWDNDTDESDDDGSHDDDSDYERPVKLVVYEPTSDHNSFIEPSPHQVHSYLETLLLLGRSDCISY